MTYVLFLLVLSTFIHINKLKGVQNRGARFVTGKYGTDVLVSDLKSELK